MEILHSPTDCVDKVIARVGRDLRVATPLGGGKPNHLLNELYARAKADATISVTIYTALTLELPKGATELERRFLEPMVDRVFGNYPDLDYELARVAGTLPDNVRIIEFYFPAGKFIRNTQAQRDYISCNYTHVARDLLGRGVNVVVQQVAWRIAGDRHLRQQHQIRALVGGASGGIENAVAVALQVADDRIDLRQCNFHALILP